MNEKNYFLCTRHSPCFLSGQKDIFPPPSVVSLLELAGTAYCFEFHCSCWKTQRKINCAFAYTITYVTRDNQFVNICIRERVYYNISHNILFHIHKILSYWFKYNLIAIKSNSVKISNNVHRQGGVSGYNAQLWIWLNPLGIWNISKTIKPIRPLNKVPQPIASTFCLC